MEQNIGEMTFNFNPELISDISNKYIGNENLQYSSNFPCSVCGKRFTTEHRLTNHLHFHTTDKSFACKICHTRFPEMTMLLTHMKKHRIEQG